MLRLQLDNELIKHLYVDEKDDGTEIAKKFGVNRATIYKRINMMGIKRNSSEMLRAGYEIGKRKSSLQKATNEEIAHLYIDEKLSPCQIARQLGYAGSSNIVDRLRKMEIYEKRDRIILRGSEHKSWRGGKTLNYDGYVRVKMPEHHRAAKNGYVFEHIAVWEEYNKKELPDGWVIHHLNGIRADNRPSNLVAMKRGEHTHQGKIYQQRIRELEIENRQLKRALENSQAIFYINDN